MVVAGGAATTTVNPGLVHKDGVEPFLARVPSGHLTGRSSPDDQHVAVHGLFFDILENIGHEKLLVIRLPKRDDCLLIPQEWLSHICFAAS